MNGTADPIDPVVVTEDVPDLEVLITEEPPSPLNPLLDQLALSVDDREKIEAKNAVRVFGIQVPARGIG